MSATTSHLLYSSSNEEYIYQYMGKFIKKKKLLLHFIQIIRINNTLVYFLSE